MVDAVENNTESINYGASGQTTNCWWEGRDAAGELVCLTVYRRGAREVVRRLSVAAA